MKTQLFKAIPFALVLMFFSISAFSDPVTWYLLNVKTDDGAAVTGSFVFDADIDTYLSIDIVAGAGSVLPTQSYGEPNPVSPGTSEVLIAVPDASVSPLDGERIIALNYVSSLTNDGGTVAINVGGFTLEGFCDNGCGAVTGPSRRFTEGEVTSYRPPKPVPSLSWYMLMVLIFTVGTVGLVRRKAF